MSGKGHTLFVDMVSRGCQGGARTCVMAMIDAEKAKRPVTAYRVSFCPNAISTMSQPLTPVTRPFR